MIAAVTATPLSSHSLSGADHASGLSPQERLLALMVYSDMTRLDSAKTSINLSSEQRNQLYEEARHALEQAREAQDKSGFWTSICKLFHGDIASLAEALAVAVAAVATGGAATIVLAAIAVGAGLASKYADDLGISPKVAMALGIVAGIAAVASGDVAGPTMSTNAQAVSSLSKGVAAGAEATGAVAHGLSGHYKGLALDYKADAKAFENQQALASSSVDESLELLQTVLEQKLFLLQNTNQALQLDHQSQQQIIQDFGGVA